MTENNESKVLDNVENQTELKESCDDQIADNHENKCNNKDHKKKKCIKQKESLKEPINKLESFLIFLLTIFIVGLYTMFIQTSIMNSISGLKDQVGSLSAQVTYLENHISMLEMKVEQYASNSDKPINITVNVDGNKENSTDDEETTQPDTDSPPSPDFDTRPFLGVAFVEGNDGTDNPLGLRVDYIYQYSPADFVGMKPGDIITSINGTKINTYSDLDAAISKCKAQDTITITIITTTDVGITEVTVDAVLTYRGNFDLGD